MEEQNEMTIGRTEDPKTPSPPMAFEAAGLFGTGSRTPSGPAACAPRQQAGHMIAVERVVRLLDFSLASKGPSTHGGRRRAKSDSHTGRRKRRLVLLRDIPAVDNQFRSRYERRLVGGQEQHAVGDLDRFAQP